MSPSSSSPAHGHHSVLPSQEAVAHMFDGIAPRYDLMNTLLSLGQDRRWRAALVRELPPVPGGRLLDVACGTGAVLAEAARQAPRLQYDQYLGVDVSAGMLSMAQSRYPDLEFRLMNADRLELEQASVNALTIAFGLRNVVQKEQALKEFARVLRPGGKLLILEFFLPERGLLSQLFLFYFRFVLPRLGGLLSNRAAYEYLPESVRHFYSRRQLVELLAHIGLRLSSEKSFLFGGCRLLVFSKPS